MSSKEAAPQGEPAKETKQKNDATHASSSWLGYKLDRWLGHGARTLGGEYVINASSHLATLGALNVLGHVTKPPIQPIEIAVGATGLGGVLAAAGAWAEWNMGMKHAKHKFQKFEKAAFWLSKVGQAAAPAVWLSNPAIATGLYAAGALMAFRGMSHRPEAVKSH